MDTFNALDKADAIAADSTQGPDQAARFLAPYRQAAFDALPHAPLKIRDLSAITAAQMKYLNDANAPDKACGIGAWFVHLLHHLEETHTSQEYKIIKYSCRDAFSQFFYRYARSLGANGQIENMRLNMRTAIDLSRSPIDTICLALHFYLSLLPLKTLENTNATLWFIDRCAECLAVLDFSGLHNSPFRAMLDEFQWMMRDTSHSQDALKNIQRIAQTAPADETVQTFRRVIEQYKNTL